MAERDDLNDQEWNREQRKETPTERLDRNWSDLLQELRVLQTGVQFLTGFLLTLPFQTRFASLSSRLHDLYLATVACAVVATGLLVAPVGVHRMLFRRHARRVMVNVAATLAKLGLLFLGLALVGVVGLIFSVVANGAAGIVAAVAAAVTVASLWWLLPHLLDRPDERDQD